MAVSKTNVDEIVPLLNWFRDEWRYCVCFKINLITPNGRASSLEQQGLLFGPLERKRICDEIGSIANGYPFTVLLHVDPAFAPLKRMRTGIYCGGHCGYQHSLGILSNGSVTVCSLGKIDRQFIFGHVSDICLAETWRGNATLKQIHEGVEHRLQGVCGRCIFRRACAGGCRALALEHSGSLFAPDPLCQALFDAGGFPESRLLPNNKL